MGVIKTGLYALKFGFLCVYTKMILKLNVPLQILSKWGCFYIVYGVKF